MNDVCTDATTIGQRGRLQGKFGNALCNRIMHRLSRRERKE
jgi:hypothetical protein